MANTLDDSRRVIYSTPNDWTADELEQAFRAYFEECLHLMKAKNADYGNSWAGDHPITLSDTIKHKTARIRNMIELEMIGRKPQVSEGVEEDLLDIINYAIFLRILYRGERPLR